MGYDWKTESEKTGTATAEKLPAGTHEVTISRVLHGKKDGTRFAAKDGSPQIMLIFADEGDREASLMVTLSDKGAWMLAKILRAVGANVERMTERGITPDRFEDETFAEKNLVGRRLTIEVTYRAYNGKQYANVAPVMEQPAGFDPDSDQPREDDIPF
jgi:hypothetical protein